MPPSIEIKIRDTQHDYREAWVRKMLRVLLKRNGTTKASSREHFLQFPAREIWKFGGTQKSVTQLR